MFPDGEFQVRYGGLMSTPIVLFSVVFTVFVVSTAS
jgi:hypothetical protein